MIVYEANQLYWFHQTMQTGYHQTEYKLDQLVYFSSQLNLKNNKNKKEYQRNKSKIYIYFFTKTTTATITTQHFRFFWNLANKTIFQNNSMKQTSHLKPLKLWFSMFKYFYFFTFRLHFHKDTWKGMFVKHKLLISNIQMINGRSGFKSSATKKGGEWLIHIW